MTQKSETVETQRTHASAKAHLHVLHECSTCEGMHEGRHSYRCGRARPWYGKTLGSQIAPFPSDLHLHAPRLHTLNTPRMKHWKHEATRSPRAICTPLTPYAACGFAARAGALYVVEGGTLIGKGATAGVVGTSLVWRTRKPADSSRACGGQACDGQGKNKPLTMSTRTRRLRRSSTGQVPSTSTPWRLFGQRKVCSDLPSRHLHRRSADTHCPQPMFGLYRQRQNRRVCRLPRT